MADAYRMNGATDVTRLKFQITEKTQFSPLTKKDESNPWADGEFFVMKAESLKGKYDYDEDYSDIKKLTVKLNDVRSPASSALFHSMSFRSKAFA